MKTKTGKSKKTAAVENKKEVIWGLAGPWYGDYECWSGDTLMKQLDFIVTHGFKSMAINLEEMKNPERRDTIAQIVADNDLELTTHVGFDMSAEMDTIKRKTDTFLKDMDAYAELLNVPIVTTGAGFGHRFDRNKTVQEKIERMSKVFAPVAKALYDMGRPLGIENHGDFYCSDLVELCRMTPYMNIFLDTGNTYLIGEKSIPACREAAPYVIGTHFKDHFVEPDGDTLTFKIKGACLGDGDVGLDTVYHDLVTYAKADKLVLHWELIVPEGMNALEAVERSWEFIRTL